MSSSAKSYVSPKPPVGPVVWSHSTSGPWYPALVTTPGHRATEVVVFYRDAKQISTKIGARHKSDPDYPMLQDQSGGVWDYTDSDKRIACLEEALDELSRKALRVVSSESDRTPVPGSD